MDRNDLDLIGDLLYDFIDDRPALFKEFVEREFYELHDDGIYDVPLTYEYMYKVVFQRPKISLYPDLYDYIASKDIVYLRKWINTFVK